MPSATVQDPLAVQAILAHLARFALMLRLYWPKETNPSILDGSWKPPAVTLAK